MFLRKHNYTLIFSSAWSETQVDFIKVWNNFDVPTNAVKLLYSHARDHSMASFRGYFKGPFIYRDKAKCLFERFCHFGSPIVGMIEGKFIEKVRD